MAKRVNLKVHLPDWFSKLYAQATWRMEPGLKTVYLTFDDGPVPVVTPAVLDILKEHNIVATFFCVGDNVAKYPDIYKQILADGHAVGNHTFNHLNGIKHSTQDYLSNIEKAAGVIKSNLFRPPYGLLRQSQYRALKKHYNIVLWDVISCDYDQALAPDQCVRNVLDFVRDGSIITFHDSYKAQKNVLTALPQVIETLKKEGYRFDRIVFGAPKPVETNTVFTHIRKIENKKRERA